MALAHPGQSRVIIDFNGVAPEFGQDFLHDAIELASAEGTTFFDQGVDLALEGSLQQVGDEVVEVGICQTVSQSKAFLTRIVKLVFLIVAEEELVKGRRSFHIVGRHVGVEVALVVV